MSREETAEKKEENVDSDDEESDEEYSASERHRHRLVFLVFRVFWSVVRNYS